MKLKLLVVCVILLSSTAETGEEPGTTFATSFRHFHRLVLLFKGRTEEMFAEAVPLVNRLALDHPQYSDQINSAMQIISDIYNNDRFWYMGDYLKDLYFVIMQPIIAAQDECVKIAHDKADKLLQPLESAFGATVLVKLNKLRKMIRRTTPKFELVMDVTLDLLDDANKQGKKCQKTTSTALVTCSYNALIMMVNELSLLPEDPDFLDFYQQVLAIFGEIASAGGNLNGLVQAMLKDAWVSFVSCEDSRFRTEHLSQQKIQIKLEL